MVRGLLLAATVWLAGCTTSSAVLTVDLRTDWVPVAEFLSIETEVFVASPLTEEGARREAAARLDADFATGVRVAEYRDVGRGSRLVRVRLLDASGAVVAERSIRLELRGSHALTVLLTRDCVRGACPGRGEDPARTECLGGRCVEPLCAPGSATECAEPECVTDGDCPGMASCSSPRCVEGACLYALDHAACGDDLVCHPARGCEPASGPTDAGAPDAGPAPDDGGPAAPDAGPAAPDAGPPDPCPGECVAGEDDSERRGCGDCGTQSRSRTCGGDCGWNAWGSWSACSGEGRCHPGDRATFGCGSTGCGSWTCTCQDDCNRWAACGACTGDVACTDAFGGRVCAGERGSRVCPTMPEGYQTCTCSGSGTWVSCSPGCFL